jgi:hypothetical protein
MSGGRCSLNADARQIRGADASVRTEKLPEGPEWSVEPKLDGDRALAIKNYMNIWRLVPAAILLCAANAVLADTITILNPSFEANVLSCSAGPGCNTDNTLADWTGSTTDPVGFVSDILASGVFGAFKPGTGQYPAGVPDGVNVAYLVTADYSVSISQVLSATLKANDNYTLRVRRYAGRHQHSLPRARVLRRLLRQFGSRWDRPELSRLRGQLSCSWHLPTILSLPDTSVTGSPVPEPATVGIMTAAFVAICVVSRRRRIAADRG